ncbi:hypothetical protein GCM10007164_11120 [Luteimonas padinae]|nr:hypothetical protein GCM10007164_11120 [Luteimonas padinae]
MLSTFHTSQQSSELAQESSMLDSLWGVQDSLGGAKTRDSSRRFHSPLAEQTRGGMSCLA